MLARSRKASSPPCPSRPAALLDAAGSATSDPASSRASLGGEVAVDGGHRDAGSPCHGRHRERGGVVLGQQGEQAVDDAAAGGGGLRDARRLRLLLLDDPPALTR